MIKIGNDQAPMTSKAAMSNPQLVIESLVICWTLGLGHWSL
jgi:hypothetical protein